MNAALLLLATCMSDAHPITSTPDCASCAVVSDPCGGCDYWTWFWGKKKECGHHIHCPHPGPIPGMEHPTLKQRIKDRLCPNHCTPPESRTCDDGCRTPVNVAPPAAAEPLTMPSVGGKQSNAEKLRTIPSANQPTMMPSPYQLIIPVKYSGPSPY